MNKAYTGGVALVSAALFWALTAILSRFIGIDFGSFYLVAIRSVILSTVFFGLYFIHRNWKKINKADYKWFGIMSIPNAFSFASLFIAINHLPISTVLFIFYAIITIGSYAIGLIIFRERLTPVKTVSLLLSLIGLGLIYPVSLPKTDSLYVLLAMISGAGVVAWNNFSKKVSSKYPLSEILAIDGILILFISFLVFLVSKETPTPFTFSLQWLWVFILIPVTLLAEFTTVYGFRYTQVQVGSLIQLLEVVFGTILAWFLFSEIPVSFSLIGGILILIAAALPHISRLNSRSSG